MSIPQSGGGPIEHHDQLAQLLADGCKPKQDWRIGTEHEKFGYCKDTFEPIPYEGERSIKALLQGLRDKYGWAEVVEEGNLTGLTKNGANVSLEPGGQLELSGAPLESIHQTCDEANDHLREVKDISENLGMKFFGMGAAPDWKAEQMPMMPKGRYKLMTPHMQKVGTHGTQMMYRTTCIQVNLDFSSEPDMVQKLRVGLALQPVATALFANSPFFEGKLTGYQSWRARIWQDTDNARTGMLPFVFEDGFGFEAWVQYALDVPMYFVYRDGKYIDALGMSFRDFMVGKLPALPGETPTLSDWADHLTTAFPEARIKQFIEMRGADGGPWRKICALPAFWVGLLYDQNALDAAWDVCKDWTAEQRENLRIDVAKDGLQAELDGRPVLDIAKELLVIAEAGLKARAKPGAGGLIPDETHFLNALQEIVDRGFSPAKKLERLYKGEWCGDINRVYAEYSY
ncbi:MAG: glutamate--cysteine ligase [Rhodobacteraceae bacterium]|nr:glutamate--cysteine ligase [Paracoccaceae bacterium]